MWNFVSCSRKMQQKQLWCWTQLTRAVLWEKNQVSEWFSCFKTGEMSISDKPRSGVRQLSKRTKMLKKFVHLNSETDDEPLKRWGSYLDCIGSANFNWRFENEKGRCEFCASDSDWPAKRTLNRNMPCFERTASLAPCDFFVFPRMKRNMKGQRFDDVNRREKKRGRHALISHQNRWVWKMFPRMESRIGQMN